MRAVPASSTVDGDGRVQVSLAELIALRARAARGVLVSHASASPRAGQHVSRLYGRGMDYAESRVYQPGDDVRRMDWRLSARSGRLHSKLFEEERENRLLLLVDGNLSMRFGTRVRFKSVQAARAAALAAWQSVRGGERVGALAFGRPHPLLRPRGGPRGALAVCGALARWDAETAVTEPEPLSQALIRAGRLMHGASHVLLISDGQSCDTEARAHLLALSRRCRVGVLLVVDPLEIALPPAGLYPLEYAGHRSDVNLYGERQRQAFMHALGSGQDRLSTMAQSLGLRWRRIDTTTDPREPVLALLRAKASR